MTGGLPDPTNNRVGGGAFLGGQGERSGSGYGSGVGAPVAGCSESFSFSRGLVLGRADVCSKVNVTVKVDSPPHVMENVKVGNNNVSGVGTTTTIKLTDSKGPMSGVAVKESPTTKDDLTGKTVSGSKSNPEPVTTSSQGQIGDVVMRGLASGSEPQSKQDTADMKDFATSSPYSHTTDQTLTFSSGGQTCQCTYSETLSNVDSKGNLNTQNNSQGTNYNLTTTTPVVKQKDPSQ